MPISLQVMATITFDDGRVVELNEIDLFNLDGALYAATQHHVHPSNKDIFRKLRAKLFAPIPRKSPA